MNYKFGEYIKKKESDFLNTKVNGSDLIRISDANNYYNSYKKQFSLSGVVKRIIKFKWLIAFVIALLIIILLKLLSKYVFYISDFSIGWISCVGFMLVMNDL